MKIVSGVLEMETRLRLGVHVASALSRRSLEVKGLSKVGGGRWTSPTSHSFSHVLMCCTTSFRVGINCILFCPVSSIVPSGAYQGEHLKTVFWSSRRRGSVVTNPPSIHEDVGSIPGLAQCVKEPV